MIVRHDDDDNENDDDDDDVNELCTTVENVINLRALPPILYIMRLFLYDLCSFEYNELRTYCQCFSTFQDLIDGN